MTKEEAVNKALKYVQEIALDVGPVVEAKYFDVARLEEKGTACPADMIETYNSVRKAFRNQWVVSFERNELPGQISCPETRIVCVYETGEVTLFASP